MNNQESDRKKKIKRIMAREGLILLGVIFIAGIIIFIVNRFPPRCIIEGNLVIMPTNKIAYGIYILIFVYLFYLLIRFTIWALRTLRDR